MASSPSGSHATAPSDGGGALVSVAAEDGGEPKLSALLFDVSRQMQDALQNMLKMIGEIEQCGGDIEGEIERAKEGVAEKSRALEEEKERFQKAAIAALNILGGADGF